MLVVAVDTNGETPEILAAASLLAGHELDIDVLEPAAGATLLRFDEMRVQLAPSIGPIGDPAGRDGGPASPAPTLRWRTCWSTTRVPSHVASGTLDRRA